jgi:putative lipoic acid-binding regulatory protein
LAYPRSWTYQVIGRAEASLRAAVAAVVGRDCCTVAPGHTSRGGKYVSLRVDCVVSSEAERNALFAALRAHPATVFVL